MNLYEITGNLLALQNLMESDELDAETLADTLEAVEGEYEIKLENYCKVIKNLEADITAIKNEVTRLSYNRKSLEKNIDILKAAMFDSMKSTGTNKVKGQIFTLSIQKNGGKAPVVVDVKTADLPDELVRIKEEADIEAIRSYIEETGDLTYAHFGERGESLRIK